MINWKALVIDDVMATREGVVTILRRVESIEEVAVLPASASALNQLPLKEFNLAFVDLQLIGYNGVELGKSLIELNPQIKVIVYSRLLNRIFASEIYRQEFSNISNWKPNFITNTLSKTSEGSNNGTVPITVNGYTQLHNIVPDIIERNLERLSVQDMFMDSELIELLIERHTLYKLTPREHQCAELISQGKSNQEIAGQLGITRQAIENLINNLYHKFAIKGEPKDPSRRVLLTLAMQRWKGTTAGFPVRD